MIDKALSGASRRPMLQVAPASRSPDRKRKVLQPPAWMRGTSERAIWRRVVPELQRVNFLDDSFRDTLGRYCCHFADWIRLTREIKRDGATQLVEMTGSTPEAPKQMRRINPAIRVRDLAEKNLLDLEDRFGLSTIARHRIVGHMAAVGNRQGDLFNAAGTSADDAPVAPPPNADSPVGVLRTGTLQ